MIAILMATYNGERFLREQLASIEKQTYSNWKLYVLDDGSSDNTLHILKEFRKKLGFRKVNIQCSKHQGCTRTFLSLVCDKEIKADFYSYTDQDDIWDSNKLERAMSFFQNTSQEEGPLLYCSSSRLVNSLGHYIGRTPVYKRRPSFQNALVQNIAAGNTMIFNKFARDLLNKVGVVDVQIHDWWTYIVVTACGGKVYFDPLPSLSYRQHENNLIGVNTSFQAFFKSMMRLLQGKFKAWNERHIFFLDSLLNYLSKESLETFEYFKKARQGCLLTRLIFFVKAGIFRQSKFGTFKLFMACIFNKI